MIDAALGQWQARDEGTYRQSSTEEQRRQVGCDAGRTPLDPHHGLLGRCASGVGGREGGSNSVVESQPSKLLVAGSIPVSRSSLRPPELREGCAVAVSYGWQANATVGRCSSVGRARPW